MEAAQTQYVDAHQTKEFSLRTDFRVEGKAGAPHRVPDRELQKARKALAEAAYRFLSRCRGDGLISEAEFSTVCTRLGLNLDGQATDR